MATFAKKLQSCHELWLKIASFLETALHSLGCEKKHSTSNKWLFIKLNGVVECGWDM